MITREHQTLATHLCSYISDRSAVAIHLNRQFATRYSANDIDRMTRAKPVGERRKMHTDTPISGMDQTIKAGHGKGYDPLAKALFKYHAKRSDGETQAYWLKLAA